MLDRFLNNRAFRRSAQQPKHSAPEGLRLYAVGDVHGCADLLDAIVKAIRDDHAAQRDDAALKLIFLGDYVDRGPDSRGVVERLCALAAEPIETVFLKGNHEAAMLDFLAAPDDHDAWLDWGGVETIESYGVDAGAARAAQAIADDLAAALPDSHRNFLQTLALHHEEADYYFAHAGVRPGVPLADQTERDLLWIREAFHRAEPNERPEKTVVHGHHPVKKPLDAGWRIAVDTGAVWSGRLSAVRLHKTERTFLSVEE
ncbi:MAG: metallophosphoesterase family protein [Pseudomonadota bacterium]